MSSGDKAIKVNDLDPYFLGSIVLIKDEDAPEAKVVDGQQRLATLTILLAALRELTNKPEFAESLNSRIFQKGDPLDERDDQYRLTLRRRDKEFFRTYVQDQDGLRTHFIAPPCFFCKPPRARRRSSAHGLPLRDHGPLT